MREFIKLVEGAEVVEDATTEGQLEINEGQLDEDNWPARDPRVPASVQYPELDEIAVKLANELCVKINAEARTVESAMPYKAQHILEEIIKKLEERV